MVPLLTLGLAFTNPLHHLIWTGFTPSPHGLNLAIYGHGLMWWIGVVGYTYLLKSRSFGRWRIFTRTGGIWTQQQKLTVADAAASDSFGAAVALDAGRAIVGASLNDDPETDSGSAYAFCLVPDAAPSGLGALSLSTVSITAGWSDNSSNESGFKV